MKKTRLVSIALAVLTAVSIMLTPASLPIAATPAEFDAVTEAIPDGNQLMFGNFDTDDCLKNWSASSKFERIEKNSGSYLQLSNISVNYAGITLKNPQRSIVPGIYKFTGYFRMAYEGEVTHLRLMISQKSGSLGTWHVYPTSDAWTKVEIYITLTDMFDNIKICGGPSAEFLQSYCVDNFSIVKVDAIPEGHKAESVFGTPISAAQAEASNNGSVFTYPKWNDETEAQYEVQGLIINQDADSWIGGAGSLTEAAVRNYALGFEGSHVTDYMICVNNTNATFPSETWTDLPEKYTQKTENGKPVDYSNDGMIKNAYQHFIVNGLDYIKTWCETFPTIGINPWISFRMNDAHDLSLATSRLLSDYFHENPEIRRVRHGSNTNSYYNNCQDYTYDSVRAHMLDLINEALNRYDCYGIELDFQREIWLWHTGGEYNGLDILNDFMREVDRLVKVYEVKYGHEIKIGVRCASDIQTNYDFGLDVATWAAEGIIDMVCPTARWSTTDNDVPVRLWVSLMHPFGVMVWPGIETRIAPAGAENVGSHTLETFAGTAASYLSQGADKVYLFNYYRGATTGLVEADRISTDDNELSVSSGKGYWNVITTIGSYDKLMTRNRRLILTYNDTKQLWVNSNSQLPKIIGPDKNGNMTTGTIRLPVGDVPAGATVTLKFSVSSGHEKNPPVVFINSKPATFAGVEKCEGGYTSQNLLCYTVPAEAHDDMYVVAEITPQKTGEILEIKHAEVYVEVAG